MKRLTVAAITGTRADFGILRPVLEKIAAHPGMELFLIVVGMHLSNEFGSTIKEIEESGLKVSARLDNLNEDDTGAGMARYIGRCIQGFSDLFAENDIDVLILLGDRGEMLAGAIVASCMNILIAHIHSGESSGSVDEGFRHAISKLSHIFFTATERGKERLIDLREDPSRIYIVGAPGLDGIQENLIPKESLEEIYRLDLSKPTILLVQHPVVTEFEDTPRQIKAVLDAISELRIQTIVIHPNADAGGRIIIEKIKVYAEEHPFLHSYVSLPRIDYLSLLGAVTVMVGNSSSGIIEAPSFGLPVVNVGTRQKGRLRAGNVLDVDYDKEQIKNALIRSMQDEKFRKELAGLTNP
ncbi:MAG: UDP-N-acetylglucosamine 2-epimerase, partial [Candidatus Hodarchaeota archaeon]